MSMKNILMMVAVFAALQGFAETQKPVKSEIKKVTVFTQGAQVFRSAGVTLSPGVTNLVFNGVSQYINAASIQAGGKGNFIILDLKYQVKYPEPPATSD